MFRGTTRTMELSKPCPQKVPSTPPCVLCTSFTIVCTASTLDTFLRDTASQVDHSTSSACRIDTSQEPPTCIRAHQTQGIWTKTTLRPNLRHHHIPWALRLLCTFSRSVIICGTPKTFEKDTRCNTNTPNFTTLCTEITWHTPSTVSHDERLSDRIAGNTAPKTCVRSNVRP